VHICTLIWKNSKVMAKVCQITGKRTRVGNNVSHANNKTKRKFFPNLQKKRFFLPSSGEWVTLKVATSALRTINKNGIEATIQKAYEKGTLTF
jgi:large subunit ribosomal protein L28